MPAPKETAEWDENQLKPITDRLSVEEKVALVQVAQLAEMFGKRALGFDAGDPLYLGLHQHLRTLGMRPTGATAKVSVPWVFHIERGL